MSLVTTAYLIAALAFALLATALLVSRRRGWPFNYLLGACLLLVAWATLMVFEMVEAFDTNVLVIGDALHAFALLLFLGQLIGKSGDGLWQKAFQFGPWLVPLVALALVFSGDADVSDKIALALYLNIGLSLVGLLATEQVFRNAGVMKRKAASLLAFAFALVFVFDLFVYSNAIIVQVVNVELWAARAFVNALAAPLIFAALRREANWQSGLFVSRQVVFYSASLIGVGVYLILIAFGGALVQRFGGEWGDALKVAVFVIGIVFLMMVLFSRGIQRRFKVFLATHFYANRYDYREEWLKLIGRLAQDSERAPMPVLCLEALADIVDSDGGALWQRDAANPHLFRVQASFNYRHSEPELARSHPLIAFLASTGWVVDGRQAIQNPEHYSGALTSVQALVSEDVLFIPLMLDDTLTGVVSLSRPTAMPDLNFEDHDLLRTVGRQLAVFLEQTRVQQQLTQARQFEVFNRFSAFVMHDLKNLIAQQSLVVSNAVKHKSNPAFVEDAIGTIENSVRRMNRLLEQLQSGGTVGTNRTVDVLVLVADACKQAADRKPQPVVIKDTDAARLPMFGDAEKLASAIHHLLRNAQDATPSDGTISVTVSGLTNDGNVTSTQPVRCKISIADTGTGMDRAFIERRLFEPFDSTKGAKGMGIGMYQARDYIESLSGTLDVESTPGEGTTMHVVVPLTFSLQAD